MSSYGKAALYAVRLVKAGRANDPIDAWEKSTISQFGKGTSSQLKSCPRDAFLGLCEAGFVRGISPGTYTQSTSNKEYALAAARFLKAKPLSSTKPTMALWRRVMKSVGEPEGKTHNQQMDVVLTLFQNGDIR